MLPFTCAIITTCSSKLSPTSLMPPLTLLIRNRSLSSLSMKSLSKISEELRCRSKEKVFASMSLIEGTHYAEVLVDPPWHKVPSTSKPLSTFSNGRGMNDVQLFLAQCHFQRWNPIFQSSEAHEIPPVSMGHGWCRSSVTRHVLVVMEPCRIQVLLLHASAFFCYFAHHGTVSKSCAADAPSVSVSLFLQTSEPDFVESRKHGRLTRRRLISRRLAKEWSFLCKKKILGDL